MRTIKFKSSYEDIITRIPGLFAYIETDEKGNTVLHKATDSPMGCYGKIVENITIKGFEIKDIIEKGKSYPFKYLMKLYYNNKENEDYKNLIEFIDRGIGKIEVDKRGLNIKENDLVPSHIYLANINSLYEEMLKLQSACEFYRLHKENKNLTIDFETEKNLCCKCVKYRRKGGDVMLKFLQNHLKDAEEISNEYYEHATNNNDCLKLNFNINLISTERDLGTLTPLNVNSDNIVNENIINKINLSYKTNSKLKQLRRFKNYINIYGDEETPSENEDWLFYYRVGSVCNLAYLNDDIGNIECSSDEVIITGNTIRSLIAYGDIIKDVIVDEVNRTLTFIYITDAHLIAEITKIEYDEDNNEKIHYKNFKFDEESFRNGSGIEYEEIYIYEEGSDIDKLIENGLFESYINGLYDEDSNLSKLNTDLYKLIKFGKFEFSLINSLQENVKLINGKTINYNEIVSNKVTTHIQRPKENDDTCLTNIIRIDFYEGVSYSPTERIDVNISRGVV